MSDSIWLPGQENPGSGRHLARTQGVSGRRGRGLTHGGRPAGPVGQPAVGVGVRGPRPAQTPRRGVQVAKQSSLSAGGRGSGAAAAAAAQVRGQSDAGWRGAAGGAWLVVRRAAGAQPAARGQDGGPRCRARAGQGGGALQGQAQRQQRQPGALFLEQRQARRGRGGGEGAPRRLGAQRGAGLGRERGGGRLRRPAGSPPSAGRPAPGPRLRRPRSPRPPPSRRRASSRPESPGNH